MIDARTGLLAMAVAGLTLAAGCGPTAPPPDPAYVAEIEAWRADREARLRSQDGWLSLVALEWLSLGDNAFGSDPALPVVLPGEGVPARVGVLTLAEDGSVTVRSEPGSGLTVAGEPVSERPLATDAGGSPDVLRVGGLSMYVIARGDRFALRVKDPNASTRTGFAGLDAYPIDPGYRVTATLDRFPEPRAVQVPTVISGLDDEMLGLGLLRFALDGRELTLMPLVSSAEDHELFLIFRDRTSGDTTYGAGRFLSAELADDDTAVLDFNLAYNPPCAFTPFATCPLPPEGNELDLSIEAGERYHGPQH